MANSFILLCLCTIIWPASSQIETKVQLSDVQDTLLVNIAQQNSVAYLPHGWDEFCKLKNESTDRIKFYFCDIKVEFSGKWNFLQLKDHIANKSLKYKFDIRCDHSANISVQWPLKAKNLLRIKVENCQLEHYLRGYSNMSTSNIPDELEYIHFEKSVVIIDLFDILNVARNIQDFDKDFNCGHEETVKYYIFKNNSYGFGNSGEKYLTTIFNNNLSSLNANIVNSGSELLPKAGLIRHKCIYRKLLYLDLSVTSKTPNFHLELVIENSMFPELRILNLSNTMLPNLAEGHRKWYRYFPKLEVMDLSYNLFTELEFDPSADAWDVPRLTMNMSHNNVTELKVAKLEELINMKKLYIDFSDNPLNCTCTEETRQLINFINDQSKWSQPKYQKYNFMKDLECKYPKEIEGKRLADLTTKDLNCKLGLHEKKP